MSDTPHRTSGFGLVTGEVCKRMASLGHEILVLGWWCDSAATYSNVRVEPCPVSPAGAAAAIVRCTAAFAPHYLVTLGDIPWLSYVARADVRKALSRHGTRWCLYYPVDGTLADGKLPRPWIDVLSAVDIPVTMSAFGVAASARSGIQATLIPHGCDPDLFRPPHDKEEAKRRLGYEGKFILLSDVRNHRRKLIPRLLDIVKRLKARRRGIVLHLHTAAQAQEDAESYCYDVRTDIGLLGLDCARGVYDDVPAPLGMAELASLYVAADVHLLTSFGEGFGLPTLQAASAGVVPIVPKNSASTELVGSHGFAVACTSSTVDEFGIVRRFIDRREAASILQTLYDDPELLRARSAAGRRFALDFSWDSVAQRWHTLLTETGQKASRKHSLEYIRQPQPATGKARHPGTPNGRAPCKPLPRPTGHDPAVLPIPRLGLPVRLELRRQHALAAGAPLVVVEAAYAIRLRVLENLFPGLRLIAMNTDSVPPNELEALIESATLVIDPRCGIDRLDLLCALRSVSFLGKSPLWPPVPGRTVLGKARLLLTDYPLSERRAAAAKRRAEKSVEVPAAECGSAAYLK